MAEEKLNSLSIVIPCFNEPENIPLLLAHVKKIISDIDFKIEIIIVDGCSSDDTPKILENEFKHLDPDHFKLILQDSRQGYGFDIIAGLNSAKNEVLAWTHADMQTDFNDVVDGFKLFQSTKKYNSFSKFIVKGKRRGRPILDVILTFGMQICVMCILKKNLNDINAQPKIFSRDFYKLLTSKNAPNDFSLDLFALYQAKINDYKILTFPVSFNKREFGEAKGGGGSLNNRINLIKRTFKYIFKLNQQL